MNSILVRGLVSISLGLGLGIAGASTANGAACFDPAVDAGTAFKDSDSESLVVVQIAKPGSVRPADTLFGVGVKGKYYGCRLPASAFATRRGKMKKVSVFLPIFNWPKPPVQGFEVDYSLDGDRILAARAIQVPWDVVDRKTGVTAACSPSTSTSFETFLYVALKNASARRCTEIEIQELVGQARR